jgi:hypothetical protein
MATWNNSNSNNSTNNPLLRFFVHAVRGCDEDKIWEMAYHAWNYDPLLTLKLMVNVRNIRGGKGERDIGRSCMRWLALFDENTRLNLEHNIDAFVNAGRFDDLVVLMNTPCEDFCLTYIANTLEYDLKQLQDPNPQPITLLAKWIPSEKKSLDRKYNFVHKLTKHMNINSEILRKRYLSPLRNKLNLLETQMCNNNWDMIDFRRIPSVAIHKHTEAFNRNCPFRFQIYKYDLNMELNTNALYPHQIIKQYIGKQLGQDEFVEAQWNTLISKYQNDDAFCQDTIVLVDVSGSMYCNINGITPITVAVSIGLLISQLTEGYFKNKVLTFESNPQLIDIQEGSLYERMQQLISAPWGGSTNVMAAIDLIFKETIQNNIKMPERILIISDMQFDVACSANNTKYSVLKNKFNSYDLPHICFWNISGNINDFPVTNHIENTSLVSGFSIDILKHVLKNNNINPESLMNSVLNDECYNDIEYIRGSNCSNNNMCNIS